MPKIITPTITPTNHSVNFEQQLTLTQVTADSKQSLEQTNNYTNNQELAKLSGILQYIRSSGYLINQAELLKNNHCRYCFHYDNLRRDLFGVVSGIERFIEQDKTSTTPRAVPPLKLRY